MPKKLRKGELVLGMGRATGSFMMGVYAGGDKDYIFLKPAYNGHHYPEYFPAWVHRSTARSITDVFKGIGTYIAGRNCDDCVSRHHGFIPCSSGIADATRCSAYRRKWWKVWRPK